MAAAGFTPISLYYTTTSGAGGIPSAGNLVNGELAINITDGKLYYKDNGGTVQVIATKATGTIGGSTTQVQYNNAGVLAGSSNLTFDGTSLTLGGNPTLSAGTANGVLYLNGSKVATSGSALTFDGTNLAIGGSAVYKLTVDVTGGSAAGLFKTNQATSDLYFQSSGTTYSYSVGLGASSDSLRFLASASEQMRLTSTGLGVGTTSPSVASGLGIAINGGAGQARIALKNTNTGDASGDGFQLAVDTSSNAYVDQRENAALIFNTNNTERARITSGGDLLVGTTSSGFNGQGLPLVVGSGSSNTGMTIYSGTTGYGTIQFADAVTTGADSYRGVISYKHGDEFMYFSTNATERARITSGGDLQISSGGSFQVGGTAARATTAGTNRIDIFNGTAPVGTLTNGISLYSSSGEAYVMDAAGNATLFSPHDAETNEWVFKSKHTPTGKVLKIDVEKLLRFVNDHFGLDAVHEFVES